MERIRLERDGLLPLYVGVTEPRDTKGQMFRVIFLPCQTSSYELGSTVPTRQPGKSI